MIYAEVTGDGALVEISYTPPNERNTVHTIVELQHLPSIELVGKPLLYDAATQTAILNESAYQTQLEAEEKEEILQLMRRKNEINEAVSTYGLDYTEELSEIEERLTQLTN